MKKHAKIIFSTLLLLASSSAQASVWHIDLEASPFATSTTSSSIIYNDVASSLILTVTAYTLDVNDGLGNISTRNLLSGANGVYAGSTGAGVSSSNIDNNNLDGGSDLTDLDEGLLFTFNKEVELTYLNFGGFGTNDDFNIEVDGLNIMNDVGQFGSNSYISGHKNYYTGVSQSDKFEFTGIVGTRFLIWADGSNDEFRIDDFNVYEVAEPSLITLFGLGFAGIALSRKRKNS